MSGDNGSTGTPAAVPSSDLASNLYANSFVKGPPREGVQRVQNRLHKAKILTDELADYFAARRDLENAYLKSLQKIAKRSFLSDPSALGANFLPVYERLVGEIGELASIHGELERKLEVECEVPMRNISSKGDWGRIKEHDDSLSSTLREIQTLENQLSKDQKKAEVATGKKASQANQSVAETERSLRQTTELWETEAPFAFEAYQRIDAQRLNLTKEVITKFETARSDAAQRLMASSEQSMQVVLNFEPQTDMQEFALKNATARGGGVSSTSAAAPVTPSRSTAAATTAPPSSGLARRTSYGASTLLRRNTSNSNTNSNSAAVGQTNGLNEFGGREQQSSASIHSTDRGGIGGGEQNTPSRSSGGGGTLKNALRRFGRGRSNKNASDMQTVYGSLPEGPESSSMDPPSSTSRDARKQPEERRSVDSRSDRPGFTSGAAAAAAAAGGGAIAGSLMAPLAPTRLQSSSTPAEATVSKPQVDEEGYSIPPPDRKPWETAAGNASSPGLLDVDEDTDAFSNTPSKMTGMSISRRPLTAESNDQDQAALERMRSTLLTARSPALDPQRRNTANRRDRRDVRNTTYNSSMNMDDGGNNRASTFGLPQSSSPVTSSSPNVFSTALPGVGNGKARSITSMTSMSQIGNQTTDLGVVPQGLTANISERVNVVFTGREITKIMVVGEVSVSVKDLASTEPLHLRVEQFEQLEKAAPNPVFLKPIEGGSAQAGEYALDVAAVLAQSQGSVGGGAKATLLKYQVFISPSRWNEYAPLHISSQWRCEDHQTSILINLTPNAELRSNAGSLSGTSIEDVAISVDVTSPSVSNIMSKPTASYSSEQKKLFWKMADSINSTTDALPSKALARFQVDQKSEIRPVELRWKIPGITLSNLGLSIVDSSSGIAIGQVNRQTTSGKYLASP